MIFFVAFAPQAPAVGSLGCLLYFEPLCRAGVLDTCPNHAHPVPKSRSCPACPLTTCGADVGLFIRHSAFPTSQMWGNVGLVRQHLSALPSFLVPSPNMTMKISM